MKHPLSTSAVLLLMFFAAQVIGLLIVNSYIDPAASEQASREAGRPVAVYEQLPYGVERPEVSQDFSFILIAAALVVGTILLLLVIKFKKVSLWKLWFLLAIATTLSFALSAFLPQMAAAVIASVVSFFRIIRPNVLAHNASELFIYGGLAAIFVPILNLKSASILLILIAAYDVFAVFKSRHMISLAKFQAENKVFAGLFVPRQLTVKSAVSPIASASPLQKKEAYADTGDYAIIGGGDIGFPLLFAGTALASFGIYKTFIIPVAATAALSVLLVISKKGKFYPAMPFVAAGCFVGYGLLHFFSNL